MHTHAFAPDPEGCTMTDSIACLLPLGPLSRIATRLVMPFVFGPMFSARHRATRDWAQRVRDGKL
jgi:ligand-binding SRPBCC domain-containing protein